MEISLAVTPFDPGSHFPHGSCDFISTSLDRGSHFPHRSLNFDSFDLVPRAASGILLLPLATLPPGRCYQDLASCQRVGGCGETAFECVQVSVARGFFSRAAFNRSGGV